MDPGRDDGAIAAEQVALLVLVAALVAVLAGAGFVAFVTDRGTTAACLLSSDQGCVADATDVEDRSPPVVVDPRLASAQAVVDALAGRDDLPAAALAAAQAAIDAGDVAAAEELLRRLDLLHVLVTDPERGRYVTDLLAADEDGFDALLAAGTIYLDDGRFNTAYFQLPSTPGGGLLVMDYFIESATSGALLKGDDRDHADPFASDLGLEASRLMLVVDLSTGRGQVLQTETCTIGSAACNEPRPITLDGGALVNDTGNDATGEGLNLDIANQFWITPTAEGFRLDYDALNSITPAGSIDGGVDVVIAADGSTVELRDDDREHYPSIGTYYYPPGGGTLVVEQRGQEVVGCGAIPIVSELC